MFRRDAWTRGPRSVRAIFWVAAVTVGIAGSVGCSKPRRSPAEFSVVLVTLDTTRADKIGAFGGTAVPTPNLDGAAREGVKFLDAIAQAPLTLPSHGSILTGRYPASHGVRHNGVFKLPESEETLAERLTENGFETAAFVGAFVLNHGFGTNQGFKTYGDLDTARYEGGRDNLYESRRTADEVNAAAFQWLDHRPKGRFFLWVHYYDAHHPYKCPEKPGQTLDGSGYDRCVSYLDAAFGDLKARLRGDGLLDNVILVVAGDHGESLGEHREQTHGIFLYQGPVHVPLLIRAPGLLPEGKVVDGPVELVDVAPTLLDILGLRPLDRAEGVSLVPAIEGRGTPPRLAFAETMMPRIEFGWSELRSVQDARYQYVEAPKPELYDLRKDPQELDNLADSDKERASDMAATLSQWVARTQNPDAEKLAQRVLSPDEESKLRSLGYLGTIAAATSPNSIPPDPKDRIEEGLMIYQARELLEAGENDKALAIFDRILKGNPRNHLARSSKIQALVRLERLEEAEVEALAAVEVASKDPLDAETLLERARRTLASIYWMRGENEKAESQYKLAVELNKDNAHAAVFGGLLLGAASGMQDATRIVDQVLERNPRDKMAMAARFELQFGQNNRDDAYKTAGLLAELDAGDWDTLFKAGKLAREYKNPKLASRLFELADQRKPNDAEILGYLGTSLLASGDLDGAEKALLHARKLRPDDPRGPFYLENIALLRNDESKARALMAECLSLDHAFVPAKLNLARWLGDKGRIDEALAVTNEALQQRPDDTEAKALLKQLQAISERRVVRAR